MALKSKFASPFCDYRFEHPDTKWFNIASRLGTKSFFLHNAKQILDFFAYLVARRLKEGLRPLLIAKLCYLELCRIGIEHRLRDLGIEKAIVIRPGKNTDLSPRHLVPIINYGTIGINQFKDFQCAYCLTGYYINQYVLDSIIHDIVASDKQIPIHINTGGIPRRRTIEVVDHNHRYYDVQQLAQLALDQQETDVVLQAVGRVRPYTNPREIITFQCADHPVITYTKEFSSITEARRFFNIPNKRKAIKILNRNKIRSEQRNGLTQQQVANKLNISIRTVKRHWFKT